MRHRDKMADKGNLIPPTVNSFRVEEQVALRCRTAVPAPKVHTRVGNLKNISILKNTSLQLIIISVSWCFTRHTSVWIKCYDAKHSPTTSKS